MQLPVPRLACTLAFLAGKCRLTVAIVCLPPVALLSGELPPHGEAPGTGFLELDHVEPLGDLGLDVLLAVVQGGVVLAADGTLVGVHSLPLVAVLSSSSLLLVLAVLTLILLVFPLVGSRLLLLVLGHVLLLVLPLLSLLLLRLAGTKKADNIKVNSQSTVQYFFLYKINQQANYNFFFKDTTG